MKTILKFLRTHRSWVGPLVGLCLATQIYGVLWPYFAPTSYFQFHLFFAEPTEKSVAAIYPHNPQTSATSRAKTEFQASNNRLAENNPYVKVLSDSENLSAKYVRDKLLNSPVRTRAQMVVALNNTRRANFVEAVEESIRADTHPLIDWQRARYLFQFGDASAIMTGLRKGNAPEILLAGDTRIITALYKRRKELNGKLFLKLYREDQVLGRLFSLNYLLPGLEALPDTATLADLWQIKSQPSASTFRLGLLKGVHYRWLTRAPSEKLDRVLRNTLHHQQARFRAYAAAILQKRYGLPEWTLGAFQDYLANYEPS